MPEAHRSVAEWTPERITKWAGQIGEKTSAVVLHVMQVKAHPEQGFNSALGIIRLANRYSPERLEKRPIRQLQLRASRTARLKQFWKIEWNRLKKRRAKAVNRGQWLPQLRNK